MCLWQSIPAFSHSFHSVPLSHIQSASFYPPLCARLLFIERFGRGIQAFRPKKLLPCSPPSNTLRSPSACPTLLPLLSPPTSGFVHTSSKKPLFRTDYLWPAVCRGTLYVITPWSRQRHRWVLQELSPLIGFPQFRAHRPKCRRTLCKKPVILKYLCTCMCSHRPIFIHPPYIHACTNT